MRLQAKSILLNNQLVETNTDSHYLYRHYHKRLGYARINVLAKTYTCHKYFEKGVCKHLIAACLKEKNGLSGLQPISKKFQFKRRKAYRKAIDDSREEEAFEEPPRVEAGRGRCRGITQPTSQYGLQRGRGAGANKGALVNNTEPVPSLPRRSERNK